MDRLNEVIEYLAHTLNLKVISNVVATTLAEISRAEVVAFYLVSEDGNYLDLLQAEEGIKWAEERKLFKEHPLFQQLQERKIMLLQNPHELPHCFKERGIYNYLAAPLYFQEHAVGLIELGNISEEYIWQAGKKLEKLSINLPFTLINARNHQKVKAQATRLKLLNEISQTVNKTLNVQEIFHNFLDLVQTVCPSDRIALVKVDKIMEQFEILAVHTKKETRMEQGNRYPLTGTAVEYVCRQQKSLFLGNIQQEPKYMEDFVLGEEGIKSVIRVPLIVKDEVVGAFQLSSYRENNYRFQDLELMEQVASHLAAAVANALLYGTLEYQNKQVFEQNRHLSAINAIARVISGNLELEQVIEATLEATLDVTGRLIGGVFLTCPHHQNFHLNLSKVAGPVRPEEFWSSPIMVKWAEEAADKGYPLCMNLKNSTHQWPAIEKWQVNELTFLPLISKNKVLGVMALGSEASSEISTAEIELLMSIASHIGVAIENSRLYEQIKFLAERDSLTGLFNRRKFFDFVERELSRAKRYGETFSILLLDVDDFKIYNDKHGHLAGDEVLLKIGEAISSTIRDTDLAARYGGEEFIIVALEANKKQGVDLAQRIRKCIEAQNQKTVFTTVSIGVATFPSDGDNIGTIIDRADRALYLAKRLGRNRVESYQSKY